MKFLEVTPLISYIMKLDTIDGGRGCIFATHLAAGSTSTLIWRRSVTAGIRASNDGS